MKTRKCFALLLALVMLTALCACGDTKTEAPAAPTVPASAPASTPTPEPTPEPTPMPTPEPTPEPEPQSGIRPEFKEAMDSYLAFYREYAEVMKKYAENPLDPAVLAEYGDMLIKAADMEEKFAAWDESEMSSEEVKYYMEVTSEVLKITAEVEKLVAGMIPTA